ncbi:MAG: TonB-dependent receptor [Acidobacteriia bacterium]|nr:TonB-dependent receptor [Terriglobia bacterium]
MFAKRFVWLVVLLGGLATSIWAQTGDGGVITGHVRGPGGVSVPGATVQLIDPQSGERKETWTDESGNYTFSGLHPGTYKLEVSLLGFRTDVREPIPVDAGKTLKVNAALVFAYGEESGPQVARSSGPRNAGGPLPAGLPQGDGGMAEREGGGQGPALGGGEGTVRLSEAGGNGNGNGNGNGFQEEAPPEGADASASAANSFLLAGGNGVNAPTPGDQEGRWRERIQQYRTMGGGGQEVPGFGGGGGGPGGPGGGPGLGGGPGPGGMGPVMIFGGGPGPGGWAGRRSQVNRIRGNIFDRYTNSAFDARPYPLNIAESPQIASYQESFGVGLGGPLVIPKIYNGGTKTSFFFNYSLQRGKSPFDSFATVPTFAERGGDFSQATISSGPLAGTVPTIYNPASNPRTPFSGNVIPTDQLNPAALGLLQFIPLPNLPGAVQNFHLQESLPSSTDRVMGRIGHQISKTDSLNAFYFFNSARRQSVSSFPELTTRTSIRSQNLALSETHTFGPGRINVLLVNFNRQRTSTLNPFAFTQNIAGNLGIQGISSNPFDWGIPVMQFTNFTALNDVLPSLTRNQTVRLSDILMINRGKHTIRLGAELRRVQLNTLTDPDARGTFTFTGFTTSDFVNGFPVPSTGFDFADFLLGLPQSTSVRFGTSSNYFRSWVTTAFFQDDWRVTSRFTMQYGLRYEYFLPFSEKYGHLSDLALGPGFSSASVVTSYTAPNLPNSLIHSDADTFAPRIGLAFRPWLERHWVLRAGYSIFYDGSIYSRLVPNLANQPPFAQASTLLTSPTQVLTLQDGFPTVAPTVASNTYAVDSNFRTPYAQTWNFSVENEIAPNVILSVGYVGIKGTKLDLLLAPNQAAPGSPLTSQQRLSIPGALFFDYETSGAASIYHGLQVSLRRQFHAGFSMSGQYTFSKSIDDAASVGGAGRTVAQNSYDLQAERGLSAFDVRHRLIINHTYEFPFGDRRRWLSHGGPAAAILGNWQLSGVTTFQSGTAFTARVLGNQSNNSGTGPSYSERADVTGLPVSLPRSQRTTLEYFNTAAFALPPPGEFGDAARNTIPGPGTVNFNMSLSRFITLSQERGVRAEFRVEADNLFNTPNFSGLATVVNAQDFGRITSVKAMRALTVSMRVRF